MEHLYPDDSGYENDKPYVADLIAYTEPSAERLEFVERDVATVRSETSKDGYVSILRDFDGDIVGFCLEGSPFQWSAFKDQLAARDRRIAELEEALKPFAALCNEIEQLAKKEGIPPEGWAKACTWEDCRRAKAVLEDNDA